MSFPKIRILYRSYKNLMSSQASRHQVRSQELLSRRCRQAWRKHQVPLSFFVYSGAEIVCRTVFQVA